MGPAAAAQILAVDAAAVFMFSGRSALGCKIELETSIVFTQYNRAVKIWVTRRGNAEQIAG
jgi:hypothetical protein